MEIEKKGDDFKKEVQLSGESGGEDDDKGCATVNDDTPDGSATVNDDTPDGGVTVNDDTPDGGATASDDTPDGSATAIDDTPDGSATTIDDTQDDDAENSKEWKEQDASINEECEVEPIALDGNDGSKAEQVLEKTGKELEKNPLSEIEIKDSNASGGVHSNLGTLAESCETTPNEEIEEPKSPEIGPRRSKGFRVSCLPSPVGTPPVKTPDVGVRKRLRVHVFEAEKTTKNDEGNSPLKQTNVKESKMKEEENPITDKQADQQMVKTDVDSSDYSVKSQVISVSEKKGIQSDHCGTKESAAVDDKLEDSNATEATSNILDNEAESQNKSTEENQPSHSTINEKRRVDERPIKRKLSLSKNRKLDSNSSSIKEKKENKDCQITCQTEVPPIIDDRQTEVPPITDDHQTEVPPIIDNQKRNPNSSSGSGDDTSSSKCKEEKSTSLERASSLKGLQQVESGSSSTGKINSDNSKENKISSTEREITVKDFVSSVQSNERLVNISCDDDPDKGDGDDDPDKGDSDDDPDNGDGDDDPDEGDSDDDPDKGDNDDDPDNEDGDDDPDEGDSDDDSDKGDDDDYPDKGDVYDEKNRSHFEQCQKGESSESFLKADGDDEAHVELGLEGACEEVTEKVKHEEKVGIDNMTLRRENVLLSAREDTQEREHVEEDTGEAHCKNDSRGKIKESEREQEESDEKEKQHQAEADVGREVDKERISHQKQDDSENSLDGLDKQQEGNMAKNVEESKVTSMDGEVDRQGKGEITAGKDFEGEEDDVASLGKEDQKKRIEKESHGVAKERECHKNVEAAEREKPAKTKQCKRVPQESKKSFQKEEMSAKGSNKEDYNHEEKIKKSEISQEEEFEEKSMEKKDKEYVTDEADIEKSSDAIEKPDHEKREKCKTDGTPKKSSSTVNDVSNDEMMSVPRKSKLSRSSNTHRKSSALKSNKELNTSLIHNASSSVTGAKSSEEVVESSPSSCDRESNEIDESLVYNKDYKIGPKRKKRPLNSESEHTAKVLKTSEKTPAKKNEDIEICPVDPTVRPKVECIDLSSDEECAVTLNPNKTIEKICRRCRDMWNDEVLNLIFKGTECVTVNSKITYGAIVCINKWINCTSSENKEKAIINVFERADLGRNIAKLNIKKLDEWLDFLLQSGKNKCCDVFTAVYGSEKDAKVSQPKDTGMLKKAQIPLVDPLGTKGHVTPQGQLYLVPRPVSICNQSRSGPNIGSGEIVGPLTSASVLKQCKLVPILQTPLRMGVQGLPPGTILGPQAISLNSLGTPNLPHGSTAQLQLLVTPIVSKVGENSFPPVMTNNQGTGNQVADRVISTSMGQMSSSSFLSNLQVSLPSQLISQTYTSNSLVQGSVVSSAMPNPIQANSNSQAKALVTPVMSNQTTPELNSLNPASIISYRCGNISTTGKSKTLSSTSKAKTPVKKLSNSSPTEKDQVTEIGSTPKSSKQQHQQQFPRKKEKKAALGAKSGQNVSPPKRNRGSRQRAERNKHVIKDVLSDDGCDMDGEYIPSDEDGNDVSQSEDLSVTSDANLKTYQTKSRKPEAPVTNGKSSQKPEAPVTNVKSSRMSDVPFSNVSSQNLDVPVINVESIQITNIEELLKTLGLKACGINIYSSYVNNKPITNAMKVSNPSEADKTSPCYFNMLKERSALNGFALVTFDHLLYEPKNLKSRPSVQEPAINRFVTKRELLTLQSIFILNAETPDVKMLYQVFIEILMSRKRVLLIPDSRTLLVVTEDIRKDYNRAKSKDTSVQILNEDWDPHKIFSCADFWLLGEPPEEPTIRDVLSVFCTWKNLKKNPDDQNFFDALEVVCKFSDPTKVDHFGLCLKLYVRLCRYLYEEEDLALAKSFLNENFVCPDYIVSKKFLRDVIVPKMLNLSPYLYKDKEEEVLEDAIDSWDDIVDQSIKSLRKPVFEKLFETYFDVKHKLKEYSENTSLMLRRLSVASDKRDHIFSGIKDSRTNALLKKLRASLNEAHTIFQKRHQDHYEDERKCKRRKVYHVGKGSRSSDSVYEEQVPYQIEELIAKLLRNGIKAEQVTQVINTINASVDGGTKLKLPSEIWIKNFAAMIDSTKL